MKELEKQIILMAHKNHTHERRAPAHWRVGIKAHISQGPVELSSETKVIDGICENNWMRFSDANSIENLVSDAKNKLEGFLKSIHLEGVEWGRTSNIRPEIFLKLGFVFVTSNKIFERSKAESLMADWQKLGLDCFILAELQPGGDL